jgi:hypothetical protein
MGWMAPALGLHSAADPDLAPTGCRLDHSGLNGLIRAIEYFPRTLEFDCCLIKWHCLEPTT